MSTWTFYGNGFRLNGNGFRLIGNHFWLFAYPLNPTPPTVSWHMHMCLLRVAPPLFLQDAAHGNLQLKHHPRQVYNVTHSVILISLLLVWGVVLVFVRFVAKRKEFSFFESFDPKSPRILQQIFWHAWADSSRTSNSNCEIFGKQVSPRNPESSYGKFHRMKEGP